MIENIIEFYNVYNDTLGPALRSEKEPVMSENTFVPLYQQIKDDIKSAIEHGKYKPKEQIPTEPELSAEYSVSRVTVRRAVEELCSEGYLVKQQGRGTFVSTPRIHRKFSVSNQVVSFTKTCREYGMLAGAKVAERKIVPVREDEKAFWGCGTMRCCSTSNGSGPLTDSRFSWKICLCFTMTSSPSCKPIGKTSPRSN